MELDIWLAEFEADIFRRETRPEKTILMHAAWVTHDIATREDLLPFLNGIFGSACNDEIDWCRDKSHRFFKKQNLDPRLGRDVPTYWYVTFDNDEDYVAYLLTFPLLRCK